MNDTSLRPTRLHLIQATVLLCGAVGMVLELTAARLLAPFFGNGLFVWTAIIGIMLGFMSIGNYLGGIVADRMLSRKVIFWILVGSAAGIGVIAFMEPVVLPAMAKMGSVRTATVASTIVLFAVPCILLGMVTPYSTRYAMTSLDHSGSTVGSLFALGTLGAILGTFLAGFYIISWVGSHDLIGWLAVVPMVLALGFMKAPKIADLAVFGAVVALILTALFATTSPIDSFDTSYDRYFIEQIVDPATDRLLTLLARDWDSVESAVYADTGEPYPFDYFAYYDLALSAASIEEPLGKTLLVGGGTFSYPRHQLAEYPDSSTDVVEIDPALHTVAREHFFLQDDPRMTIFLEDGRTFLNRVSEASDDSAGVYDVVLMDAFKSANSIPYPLTTRETMRMCYELLDDDGILVMNIIASPTGPGSRFVAAQLKTVLSVFPQAECYAVVDLDRQGGVQNISILAAKRPREAVDLRAMLERLSPELTSRRIDPQIFPRDVKVLTDDFAPVDQYLMDI